MRIPSEAEAADTALAPFRVLKRRGSLRIEVEAKNLRFIIQNPIVLTIGISGLA